MDYNIGIALSGGGMRGIAHIGALQALEEHNIRPDILAGTSAGSVIAALYASGKTPEEILDFIKTTNLFKVFKPGFSFNGFSNLTYFAEHIEKYIGIDTFEALEKTLYVYTTNLNTGEETRFQSGFLLDKLMASCAIPMVFRPLEINGQLHCDGGLVNNLPAKDLSRHAKVVIGSNVIPIEDCSNRSLDSYLGILSRMFVIVPNVNARSQAKYCDVIIEPHGLSEYHFFSLEKADKIFQKGYDTALIQIPYIMKVLEKKGVAI
jgi:NTE family protein